MTDTAPLASNARIDSWKGIARYLGRSVRTVRRWEAERALPVHRLRHDSQHSVYAWPHELDAWLRSRTVAAPAPPRRAVCAVLPFEAAGPGQTAQLALSLTSELKSLLGAGARNDLDIVSMEARNPADPGGFEGSPGAARIHADYYLEGWVSRTPTNLFCIGMRISGSDREDPVWSAEYVSRMEDIRPLQARMADEVLAALGGEGAAVASGQEDAHDSIPAEAYEAYLRGCSLMVQSNPETLLKSIEEFDLAISLHEDFAEAWAQKATALVMTTWVGPTAPDIVMPRALDACARALGTSPQRAEAHLAMGLIHTTFRFDWKAAEKSFNRAIELNPSFASAYQWRAELLAVMGQFDRALSDVERARRLDPASLEVLEALSYVLLMSRRYTETIEAMDDLLARDRNYMIAYIHSGLAWAHLGEYEKAAEMFGIGADRSGGFPDLVALKAFALGRSGKAGEARDIIAGLQAQRKNETPTTFQEVFFRLGTGEYDRAMDALETAYEQRDWHMALLAQEAIFDPLRGMPRFRALLKEVGLDRCAFGGTQ